MLPTLRILLVVDEPHLQEQLWEQLSLIRSWRFEIALTASLEAARDALSRADIDLALITPLQSTHWRGLVEQLQRVQPQHFLPLILLVPERTAELGLEALDQGVQLLLPLPGLTVSDLEQAIARILHRFDFREERLRNREYHRLLATTAMRIRKTMRLDRILGTAVEDIRRLLDCDRVLVYQFAPDMSGSIVAESVVEGLIPALGQEVLDTCFRNGIGKHYQRGGRTVITDIFQADLTPCHREMLQRFQVRANLVVPIRIEDQQHSRPQLWGLLVAHHCSAPRSWSADDISLFDTMGVQLALAIQQATLLNHTQTALEREQALNRFRSRIIATVSHEYRTPLTTILMAATTINSSGDRLDPEQQRRYLNLVETKARHMAQLVDDMLVFHQIESSREQQQPQEIDLRDFLPDLIAQMDGAHARVHLSLVDLEQSFRCDPRLLYQILTNLIANALKYSPDDREIEVKALGRAQQVIFTVRDRGIGMPERDVEQIFEAFVRGSNVANIPGTGLGLAIVKSCVDALGGHLALESHEGQGTTVTVGLPRKQSQISLAQSA